MNQTQFLSWLEQGPSSEDVEELRALVARYPFSGPLRMLLAKHPTAQNISKEEMICWQQGRMFHRERLCLPT